MQTIYLDVLIGVNVYINYLLLAVAAKVSACRIVRTRLVLSSLFGAAASCSILLEIPNVFFSIAIKLITVTVMTIIAFEIKTKKMFFRITGVLTAVTFGFAGAMIGIKNIMSTNNVAVSNFSVYMDISPVTLIFLTLVCYMLLSLCSKFAGGKNRRNSLCRLTVNSKGRSVTMDALLDTGNTLTEPFSGLPVVVVNEKQINNLMPDEIKSIRNTGFTPSAKLRVIPYTSVGGNGLLMGFMPDSITVERNGERIETGNVYIAVADRESEVPALINPDII